MFYLYDMYCVVCMQVTWRREDNGEIVVKDSAGTKQLSSSSQST